MKRRKASISSNPIAILMTLDHARDLPKNMTDVERLVWGKLRGRRFVGYKFRRQMPLGVYIVDFVCLEKRLILELDGGQHVERADYDRRRTAWLEGGIYGAAVLESRGT